MPSDDDRREVAANLRDEAEAWRTDNGDDTVYSMSDCTFTESVLTAFEFDDMEMSAYKAFYKMADLIDRPTCEMEGHPGARYGRCSHCGALVRRDAVTDCTSEIPVKFCPNCSAEVFAGAV